MSFARHIGRAALLALLLASAPLYGQAVELEKLDPAARTLLHVALAEHADPLPALSLDELNVWTTAEDGLYAAFFVDLRRPADAAALAALGARVRRVAGDIAVVDAPVALLPQMAAMPQVEAISVSRLVEMLNYEGNRDINTFAVHAGAGLPQAYRGQGVVMGVLDTGIDVTHPDFRDEGGTRIEYLLEFLPPPEGGGATEGGSATWTREQINQQIDNFPQRDIHGHGTHVAGTAAGGGRGAAQFLGVAPEARLVIVKGTRTGSDPELPHIFREDDIVDGVAWIFERAAALGMPAVVNLSLGVLSGPLDGTDPGVRAVSNLAGPGRIIVFAAGNDGARLIHAGTHYAAGDQPTMIARRPAEGGFVDPTHGQRIDIDGWYDAHTLSSIAVAARDPHTLEVVAAMSVPVGQIQFVELRVGGATIGYVWVDASITEHTYNNDGFFRVIIGERLEAGATTNVDLRRYDWSVTPTAVAAGRVDAWIRRRDMGAFITEATIPQFVPGDSLMTLNRWAAGEHILSAGAHTTLTHWIRSDGVPVAIPAVLGDRASFSSRGPTRDGRMRPDISAPGQVIASSRSGWADFGLSATIYGQPLYVMMQGTSMAAPFLSGAVALMLQVDPTLDPARAREVLHRTARADEHTGAVPNVGFGHGKLDVLAALQTVTVSGEDAPGMRPPLALEPPYPNPARGAVHLVYSLPLPAHATLTVYDLLGRRVVRLVEGEMPAGPHRAILDAGGMAAGVYVIVLVANGERQSRPLVIVR